MRILLAIIAATVIAGPAAAGSLTTPHSDPVVMSPGHGIPPVVPCSGVLLGGCGYCIGGHVIHG